MNSDADLDDLLNAACEAVKTLAYRAYESGVKHGREEARREFQDAFNRIISASAPIGDQIAPAGPRFVDVPLPQRAQPGTVRPAIAAALKQFEHGLRPAEIAAKTRLSENTVRGTLRSMKIEGVTEKRGDLWFLVQKDEPVDAVVPPDMEEDDDSPF